MSPEILKSFCVSFLFMHLLASPVHSQAQKKNNFSIKGKVLSLEKGTISILYNTADQISKSDIIHVAESCFTYKGIITEPTLATFTYAGNTVRFFIEPHKNMYFTTTKDSFSQAILNGSDTNDDMLKRAELHSQKRKYNEKNKIVEDIRNAAFHIDTIFINSYPDSFYSLYLLNFYFSDLRYEFVKEKFKKFSKKNQNTNLGSKIVERLSLAEKTLPGTVLPDFSFTTEENKTVAFKDIVSSNKLILIDFWASWCLPCRQNNPFLKSLFSKFNKQGFTILSISIDKKKEAWTETIKKDSMNLWHNGIDDNKSSIQNLFGVNLIPAFFLVNTDFEIIGRYSGRRKGNKDLKGKLEELFTN